MMIDQERIEKALVEVQAGSRESFSEVVRQTSGLLRALVNFHVHNDSVASDVLQDGTPLTGVTAIAAGQVHTVAMVGEAEESVGVSE